MDKQNKKLQLAVLAKRARQKRNRAAKAAAIRKFGVQVAYLAHNDNFPYSVALAQPQRSGGSMLLERAYCNP